MPRGMSGPSAPRGRRADRQTRFGARAHTTHFFLKHWNTGAGAGTGAGTGWLWCSSTSSCVCIRARTELAATVVEAESSPTCYPRVYTRVRLALRNYMDYTSPLSCMDQFTEDQARIMRCTIAAYRPNVVISWDGSASGGASPPAAPASSIAPAPAPND